MKRKHIATIFWIMAIILLASIFFLSSQNGEQTEKISRAITEKISAILLENPSKAEIDSLHLTIRLFAHAILFFAMGVLLTLSCYLSFKKKGRWLWVLLIVGCIILGYSYYDEWQKQFIDGRHFQKDEALLNAISGVIGLVCTSILIGTAKLASSIKRNAISVDADLSENLYNENSVE